MKMLRLIQKAWSNIPPKNQQLNKKFSRKMVWIDFSTLFTFWKKKKEIKDKT
jgi:hypothetical protein